MTRLTALTAILLTTLALSAPAQAQITRTITGPNGNTTTKSQSGNCVATETGRDCSRSVTRTGPNGQTATRDASKSVACENGVCSGTKTVTTPGGKSFTRSGSVTRN